MPRYVLHHCHEPRECGVVFARSRPTALSKPSTRLDLAAPITRRTDMSRTQKTGRKLALLALAAAIATAAVAACGGKEERQVSNELATGLQQILDGAVGSPETAFPGTALYVSQPELGTWAGAAGEGNIDPATPMRAGDTFRVGSIAKTFVAAATLRLVEEGKFALDDPLPSVLPEDVVARVADADRITVRMLLNQTSGIPEWNDEEFDRGVVADPHRVWKVEEFLNLAVAQPRRFEPGERYAYSNTNYNLLGLIIEETTGESWRAVVREQVIDRLELEHTSLPEPGDVSIGRDAAHGYALVNGELRDLSDVDPSMAGAAGGHALATTTEDLARFLNALLAGELFEQPETLEEMLTWVEATDNPGKVGYGLGLERYVLPGGVEVIGHLGTTAGYSAFVGRLPAQEIDVAMVITNRDNPDPSPVLMPALELMVGEVS
jgi:D-alanyl-D-alanine carboxypeptidase